MAVNAEKHGGFFWWMDKNEEGTTMITSPESSNKESENCARKEYDSVEDVPEIYKKYVKVALGIRLIYSASLYLYRML